MRAMRRILTWYLPLVVGLITAVVFAWGFTLGLRGNAGEAVGEAPLPPPPPPEARAPLRIVILGDSVARGTGDTSGLGIGGTLDRELRERKRGFLPTANLAVNGARTTDLLRQLEQRNVQAILGASNTVVISIGGNDLWGEVRGKRPPESPEALLDGVAGRVESIVARVRDANPKARIFVLGLYNPFLRTPAGDALTIAVNRWNAELAQRFADDRGVFVIPIADIFALHDRLALDRFHPGNEGYRLIAERIAQAM